MRKFLLVHYQNPHTQLRSVGHPVRYSRKKVMRYVTAIQKRSFAQTGIF
jgi:hypothetical protein